MVACLLELYICSVFVCFPVLVNKLLNFFNSFFCFSCHFLQFLVWFSCHLQVTMAPGPHAVKSACFFATPHVKNFKDSNECPHFRVFSISTGQNKPHPKTPESQAAAATAPSSINFLYLQRHGHGLARHDGPRNPCPAITVGEACRHLVRPYTTRPLSLKYQSQSTWHVVVANPLPQVSRAAEHEQQR